MNGYIYDKLEILSNEKLVMSKKDVKSPSISAVPDGAVFIKEVNKKKLSYNI